MVLFHIKYKNYNAETDTQKWRQVVSRGHFLSGAIAVVGGTVALGEGIDLLRTFITEPDPPLPPPVGQDDLTKATQEVVTVFDAKNLNKLHAGNSNVTVTDPSALANALHTLQTDRRFTTADTAMQKSSSSWRCECFRQ